MYYIYDGAHLWIPGGIWLSLNTILILYKATFKLFTKEFSSLVRHDFYYPWIPDQLHSFYQVRNNHHFLVAVLRYFKPPGFRVYNCNGFKDYRLFPFYTYFVGAYKTYTFVYSAEFVR